LDNRYADQGAVNNVDEFADSAMSSHYVPRSDTYASTSPSRLPSSGKTDEPPTPRQLPNGMVTDHMGPQHPQSQIQSEPPSRQVLGNSPIHNWETDRRSPPIANDEGFATPFLSAPLQNGPYGFSGVTITNGQNHADAHGSYISERAVSPAQITSQSWSKSPRASPDSHRISESNSMSSSPPPFNYKAYRPSPYAPQTVARTASPGNESIRSRNGSVGTTDAYALKNRSAPTFDQSEPSAFAGVRQASPPTHIPDGPSAYLPATAQHANMYEQYEPHVHAAQFPASQTATSDPYAPNLNARPPNVPDSKLPRANSPPSSWQKPQSTVSDPYAPPLKNGTSYVSRDRSASNSSVLSGAATGQYAPPKQSMQQSYMAPYPSAYNISASQEPAYEGFSSIGQDVSLAPATHAPYAPSPSLMGLNDPLGRSSARIPVFSFGFGGKLVTCFHGSSGLNTGFDVALSSRQSTDIQIRVLHNVIPESALDSSTAIFPGPLFCDPGSPTNSLVRTNASQVKAKKARVSKYLDERADEIHRGIAYLTPGSEDRRQADGKLVLVRLLKVMVENDGQLSGT
jgi:COPII coat assembly protein SEC16